MEYKRIALFLFLVFGMTMNFVSSYNSELTSLTNTISGLCTEIKALIPIVAMLMVVLGAVIYGAGQVMGAETRARANVWATAMIVGAIVGIMINLLLPAILGTLISGGVSCS